MEKINNTYIKNACFGAGMILLYFILCNIEGLPFALFNVNVSTIPTVAKIIYLVIYEVFMISLFALIFNKELIEQAKDMKKNHKKYFSKYFKYYLIGCMIMFIGNAIIMFLFNKGMANNEELIRQSFKVSPLYIYFSSIIYAPFIEELVFRYSIKKIISYKYLFILLSGLIFAYVHVSGYIKSPSDLLYLIPYGAVSLAFSYVYYKTDNIFSSMGLHFMHNGLLMSLQFLVLLCR